MKFSAFREVIQMLRFLEKSPGARAIYWLSWGAGLTGILLWKAGEILHGLAELLKVI